MGFYGSHGPSDQHFAIPFDNSLSVKDILIEHDLWAYIGDYWQTPVLIKDGDSGPKEMMVHLSKIQPVRQSFFDLFKLVRCTPGFRGQFALADIKVGHALCKFFKKNPEKMPKILPEHFRWTAWLPGAVFFNLHETSVMVLVINLEKSSLESIVVPTLQLMRITDFDHDGGIAPNLVMVDY